LAEFTPIGKKFTLPLREDPPSESPSRPHILLHESSKIPILYRGKKKLLSLCYAGRGRTGFDIFMKLN
jgi:hypothetical protein